MASTSDQGSLSSLNSAQSVILSIADFTSSRFFSMHIFRRGSRRRRDGQSDSAPDPRPTASSDQAGPSRAPSDSPSPVPSPLPSPITSHQESLIPARHSVATMQDTRECIVPYGDSFHNSVRVIHEINRIVNNHWRGDSMSYTSTPTATKELWWNEFKRSFTWDSVEEIEVRRIFKKKCGDHIRHVLNHAKTKGKKPNFITEDNWTRINNYWATEESQQRSQQNRTNQAYNFGDSSATYAGGSVNIDEHTRRLTKELGRDPLFIETFTRTFQKKDKTWSGDRAKAVKDKYDELELARRNSQATDESSGSEPSVGNNLDLWLEASGGSKGGRILGMGSLSRTHRLASLSSSTPPAVRTQIQNLSEEVITLKGILAQRDQDMIQRDEQMRQMQQQQDLIMRHLHLASPPSQIPPPIAPDGDDDDDADGGDESS